MPEIYSPVYFVDDVNVSSSDLKSIAEESIGRLPNTNYDIPIQDINALITHNTAILGILGIGKSCLAYELIKKVREKEIKILCFDITNEYKRELINYIDNSDIVADEINVFNEINRKFDYVHEEVSTKNYEKSGNLTEYKES